MKARLLVVFVLSFVASIPVIAQTCNSTAYTNKLICTLPQLFTPIGLTLPNPTHNAHFTGSSETLLALPINQSIGQTLSILPLGSTGSTLTYTIDPQGHHVPSEDSLGPILTERANVIGKGTYSVGVAYQYFDFSHLDGIPLGNNNTNCNLGLEQNCNFPVVLTHFNSQALDQATDQASFSAIEQNPKTFPDYQNDYVTTTNQIHVELNQAVVYAVVGVSKRTDVSIEVPIQSAHFRVVTKAHIVRTLPCEATQTCSSVTQDGTKTEQTECNEYHYFSGYSNTGPPPAETKNCAEIFNSTDLTFPNTDYSVQMASTRAGAINFQARSTLPVTDAKGIGDITLRWKAEVYRGEKLVGSVGLGIRFPSGDAKNFLGTGAYGLIPFGALTYKNRFISPHVRFGYEWNSLSIIAGNPTSITSSSRLAPAFLYSAGADFRALKRLTFAADLIGERVRDAARVYLGSFKRLPPTDGVTDYKTENFSNVTSILSRTQSYSSDSIAAGAKYRLYRGLIAIGNITARIDDGGLRSDIVPLVGLSYAF